MNLKARYTVALRTILKLGKDLSSFLHSRDKLKFTEKSTNDFVTDYDLYIEKSIINEIKMKFPEDSFICEESGSIDFNPDKYWAVDPIDGTINFIKGIPIYAISIAYIIEGTPEFGIVYNPKDDLMFKSIKGEGSFVGNTKTRVLEHNKSSPSLYIAHLKPESTLIKDLNLNIPNSKYRNFGCTSLELSYITLNSFSFFIGEKMNIWDIAAGISCILESGGVLYDLNKNNFSTKIYDKMSFIVGESSVIKDIIRRKIV